MPAPTGPISSAGLLWCEGSDDFNFLVSMLDALGIGQETLYVERLEGRSQLHDYLNGLPIRDGSQRLRALGIVCDADRDDGPTAFERIRDDLHTTGYRLPRRPAQLAHGRWGGGPSLSVGVYVMPDNTAPGTLEDLCLAALASDPSQACVDEFLDCVSSRSAFTWREQDRPKARLNAWLASRQNPTLRLRQAMEAGYIDRDSPAFGPIRQFLTRLARAAANPGGTAT